MPAPSESTRKQLSLVKGQVIVNEHNQRFTRTIYTEQHQWFADESKAIGGDDYGPNPYELLLAALGACTSMTLRMYAGRKQWPLDDISVSLMHQKSKREAGVSVDIFRRVITLVGQSLTEDQRQRLLEIANKCPVHKTLTGQIEIQTELL